MHDLEVTGSGRAGGMVLGVKGLLLTEEPLRGTNHTQAKTAEEEGGLKKGKASAVESKK